MAVKNYLTALGPSVIYVMPGPMGPRVGVLHLRQGLDQLTGIHPQAEVLKVTGFFAEGVSEQMRNGARARFLNGQTDPEQRRRNLHLLPGTSRPDPMAEWQLFRDERLSTLVNTVLSAFGWVLVFEYDTDTRKVTSVYPRRNADEGDELLSIHVEHPVPGRW